MNCDHVFDILTRGPFPTGDPEDENVERHLAACHDCRRLSEALRPAVEMFHEALAPEARDRLPGYHGSIKAASNDIVAAADTAVRDHAASQSVPVRSIHEPRARARVRYVFLKSAAGLSTAVAALLLLWIVSGRGTNNAGSEKLPSAMVAPQDIRDNEVREFLASLPLTKLCFTTVGAPRPNDIGQVVHYECCTKCHNATKSFGPQIQIATLVQSCKACHRL